MEGKIAFTTASGEIAATLLNGTMHMYLIIRAYQLHKTPLDLYVMDILVHM